MDDLTSNSPEQSIPNLFSGENIENPFPLFSQMRQGGALIPIPNPMGGTSQQAWMTTRMDETMQVLKNQALFTVDPNKLSEKNDLRESLAEADPSAPATFFTGKSMLFVDEPDHRRLRMLVSKAFTPRYMEGLRPRIQEMADELLDQVQDKGEMDVVKDYAYPLPINVISEMLGIPKDDRPKIQVWSNALARGLGFGFQDPEAAKHMRAFGEYTVQLVAKKRSHPADDLISQLVAIEEEGDRLSEEELISMITLLIFAGHETTSNLISTGTLMLLDHPEEMERLKKDPSLASSAVEELLRFNGPATTAGPRYALEETDLAGQRIKKGDMIIPLLKSANRDEHHFTDSEDLDILRKVNRHLAFGHGIHACLGAPLARLEGEIAFNTLLRRLPNLRLNIPREDVTWHFALSSQELAALPVAF